MQAMSEGMAALLKSGKQIGVNKPTHEIIIGNSGDVTDFDFGDTWVRPSTTYTFNSLSVAQKANGKLIVCNVVNNVVYEAEAIDRETLLTGDNGATGWTSTGITASAYGWATVFNIGADLFLNFSDRGVSGTSNAKKIIYKSPSGNGGDWELYSTIQDWSWSGLLESGTNAYKAIMNQVGIPIKLANGNWIMNNGYFINYSGYMIQRIFIMISTDNGVTWTNGYYFQEYSLANVYYQEFNRQIVKMDNGDLYTGWSGSWGDCPCKIIKSVDSGANWTLIFNEVSFDYWPNKLLKTFQYFNIGNQLFSVVYNGGSDANGDIVIMKWNVSDIDDNEIIINLPTTTAGTPTQDNPVVVNFGDGFILGIEEYLLGIDPIHIPLQAKSIQISRSKGMAGSLIVEFDNKAGILAPDGLTNPQLLWPNKEVTVKQGYGTELIQTFKGLIDTISMSTFPQSISISARDKMKALLDHLARDASFSYVLTYTGQTVEAIWQDLITKAGLTYGTVETTGITLTEKIFSWQTYADCISWLDEIAGFETYCDELGVLHFVLDGRPETVTTAYEFVEGVDIIQLGYDIDDKDLYYSVAVYGKDATDAVIYYAATLPQAIYWNIPSGKVMRIDAPDADTSAKCQAIAVKAIYLMQTRARQVRFSTIGIPHLQRGDFIQVTEASSTISEIYRISDISTSQGPDGYTMELTCYYHAAPEV